MRRPRIILNFSTHDHLHLGYGLYRYSVDLIGGLARIDNPSRFIVLGSRQNPVPEIQWVFDSQPDSWIYVQCPRQRCRGGYFMDQIPVAWLANRLKGDLFHGLDYFLPFLSSLPLVATIHDLFAEHQSPKKFSCAYIELFKRLAKLRTSKLVAVSEATAKDLRRFWKVPFQKIVTVPNGTGIVRQISLRARDPNLVLARYCLLPTKNLCNLVRAMAIVRNSFPDAKLVLYGRANISEEAENEFDAVISNNGLSGTIERLGFVSESKLRELYDTAGVFVLPSLIEGFGLPLIEAMSRGLCVIAHRDSAMSEVVGSAGLLVDASNPKYLSEGIIAVLRNSELREKLQSAGYQRSSYFSADRMALDTLRVYRQILNF